MRSISHDRLRPISKEKMRAISNDKLRPNSQDKIRSISNDKSVDTKKKLRSISMDNGNTL